MKILKIEIVNYKKIKILELELDGKNMNVSGATGAGKTTAISALWEILKNVGDPVTHGEMKGKIKVTLGEGNKKVFAEKRLAPKSSTVIIMTSEGEKISVKDFREWFCDLGVNPHKILDMKPLEQTEILLKAVKLPAGIDLDKLDEEREKLEDNRLGAFREMERAKKRIEVEIEELESIDVSEMIKKIGEANLHNQIISNKQNDHIRAMESINVLGGESIALHVEVEKLKEKIEAKRNVKKIVEDEIVELEKFLKENEPIKTTEMENTIENAQSINDKAAEYRQYVKDKAEYETYYKKHSDFDAKVKKIDKQKKDALAAAVFPIDGISIKDNQLYFNDCMLSNCGHSEQMLFCGALAASTIQDKKLKCVRMDGIESMSKEDFDKLEKIFNEAGIQVFSSRVSRGDKEDNEIVIVDGGIEEK